MPLPSTPWHPPSDHLTECDGVWRPKTVSAVSYPDDGNDLCYQVEDGSYWFVDRTECMLEMMRQFPPAGRFYDIGGGNGFATAALQRAGQPVVLVEPGPGALNAVRRGVRCIIRSTLEDAGFHPGSLAAAGAFDVVEHIADDLAFLGLVRRLLQPGGRFYCTVPALDQLWSDEDAHAGHYRRYEPRSLGKVLHGAGFTVEFMSFIFTWLPLPLLLLRALPSRLKMFRTPRTAQSSHRLPAALAAPVRAAHRWELSRLKQQRPLPFGSSLLCVARAAV